MTSQERITGAVMVVLALVGIWFAMELRGAADLGTPQLGSMVGAIVMIAVGSAIAAGIAAAIGGQKTDERDRIVALRAQAVRGYFYLVLTFGVVAWAAFTGQGRLANGLFLTIIAGELVAGAVMLALYRRAA